MDDDDERCARCGAEHDDHYTAWENGIPVVGSYQDAPNGRICSDLAEELKTAVRQVEAFKPVAARVVIHACIECRQEYPQWSVLSSITCPDCKSKKLLREERARCAALLDAEGRRAMGCGSKELAGVFWALEARIKQGDKAPERS